MKNVNEFTGAFNKEKLHLENVLGGEKQDILINH